MKFRDDFIILKTNLTITKHHEQKRDLFGSADVFGTSNGFLVTQYPVFHLWFHVHDREEIVGAHYQPVLGLVEQECHRYRGVQN